MQYTLGVACVIQGLRYSCDGPTTQVRLADLEKGLLEALATSEGNLLDDTSLIEKLSETKSTAAEIQV